MGSYSKSPKQEKAGIHTMENFNLAPNEGIIIQYENVCHNRKRAELVLTNHNLICVEASSGVFKTTYNTIKFPVNQIKVVNGQVQVSAVKDGDDWALQVLLRNGTEQFTFPSDFFDRLKKKQEINRWIDQISLLLTGKSAENVTDTTVVGEMKNFLGSVGINVKTKQPQNVTVKCMGCMAPLSGQQGQVVRCKYCDTEQTL